MTVLSQTNSTDTDSKTMFRDDDKLCTTATEDDDDDDKF